MFQAGRIDHLEGKIAEPALPFPPIAGHARLIVDEREAAPNEAVEKGRFADIGPTDNGDGERHDAIRQHANREIRTCVLPRGFDC